MPTPWQDLQLIAPVRGMSTGVDISAPRTGVQFVRAASGAVRNALARGADTVVAGFQDFMTPMGPTINEQREAIAKERAERAANARDADAERERLRAQSAVVQQSSLSPQPSTLAPTDPDLVTAVVRARRRPGEPSRMSISEVTRRPRSNGVPALRTTTNAVGRGEDGGRSTEVVLRNPNQPNQQPQQSLASAAVQGLLNATQTTAGSTIAAMNAAGNFARSIPPPFPPGGPTFTGGFGPLPPIRTDRVEGATPVYGQGNTTQSTGLLLPPPDRGTRTPPRFSRPVPEALRRVGPVVLSTPVPGEFDTDDFGL
jgi:hypothetical protein